MCLASTFVFTLRLRVIFIVTFFPFCGEAQFMDSIPSLLKGKAGIDARFESRYSFIGGQVATINGVRMGLAFQKKLKLGGGLSWLNTDLRFRHPAGDNAPGSLRFLKFGYLCIYADFVFHKTKRWQLSVPLQVGTGLIWSQPRRLYKLSGPDPKYFFVLYEPGITVQFKIFRWLGVGNDVAYRFVLRHDPMPQRIVSPTYSFKLLVWPDQLFFLLFPDHDQSKKRGPAQW